MTDREFETEIYRLLSARAVALQNASIGADGLPQMRFRTAVNKARQEMVTAMEQTWEYPGERE